MPTVQDYLGRGDALPPAPQILPQLLRLLSDSDTATHKIVDLISIDPALTARVMKASNSAFLGAATPAQDVGEAVNRLGLQLIYRLVAVVSGSSAMRPAAKDLGLDPAALWRHSVTAALAAQLLAKDHAMAEEGVIFTGALLHDIGKVLLANYWRKDYAALAGEASLLAWEQFKREREAWQIDHAELGGHLLASWKFSPAITAAVWHHHVPAGAAPYKRSAACVCLADAIAHTIAQADGGHEVLATSGRDAALEILSLSSEDLGGYLALTRENFEFVNAMCQLAG